MKKLSVVIAAYDEEENIEALARRLHATVGALPDLAWEVVYIVEGRDRTRAVLQGLAAELGHLRILYREEPSGLGNAFRRGFAAVAMDADLVVTLDADLNHQPEEIPRLVASLERQGADILVGSRFLAGSTVVGTPVWKRFLSGVMSSLMRLLYGVRVHDKTSGFRVYRAEALRAIHFDNSNFAFLPEMLIRAHQAGYLIVEEPIEFIFRRRGASKLRFWPTSISYLKLLRTRFDRWSVAVLALLGLGVGVRVLALLAPLGTSRAALALIPVIHGTLLLVSAYLFFRLALGRRQACLSLGALAIPPPAVLFWTSMPNRRSALLLCSALVLCCVAWLAWRRGGLLRRCAFPALFAVGLAVGAAPWIAFDLAGSLEPRTPPDAVGTVTRLLHPVVLAIYAGAALLFLAAPLLRRRWPIFPQWRPGAWVLLLGIVLAVAALNLASGAGLSRGLSPPDLLPLVLVGPALLALFIEAVWQRSPPAGLASGAAVLAFNLTGYSWP
ncbi:MAG TPA: glycosyltransferase [Thermoanaerobaculia bacterium]|nr:glycosyltransferase [Thermoanaerobaculia bacterium]